MHWPFCDSTMEPFKFYCTRLMDGMLIRLAFWMVHQQEVDPKVDNSVIDDDQGPERGRFLTVPFI